MCRIIAFSMFVKGLTNVSLLAHHYLYLSCFDESAGLDVSSAP